MKSNRNVIVVVFALLSVGISGGLLGGCNLIPGTLDLLLTDAPFPFDSIVEASVTIERIEVRQSSADGDETTDDSTGGADEDADDTNTHQDDEDPDGDDGGGFITVMEEQATFNLLDLQGGVTATLASAPLAAGTYSQVRLIVSSGLVVLDDGREFNLTVPSGEQTGIKLNFEFDITGDTTTTLLIDMDVSKAFVPTPGGDISDSSQIESFLFKPSQSIRIVEVDTTGSISGVVLDESAAALAGIAVTASLNGEEVTTTATTDDGSFVLAGLEPGTYDVSFSGAGITDQTVMDVAVTAGSDSATDDVTLAPDTGGT